MYKHLIIGAILSSLLIFSCTTAKKTTGNKSDNKEAKKSHPLDGTWIFSAIPVKQYDEKEMFENKPEMTFEANAGRFTGNGGCNSINGKITVEGDKLKFLEPIASTRMACPKIGERAFLELLPSINRFEIKGNTLHLYNDKFERMTMIRK